MLLSVRFCWGIIGTKHARFSDFIYSPKTIISFAKDTLKFKAKRYIGHNPLGGLMVLALFVLLALTSLTGLLVYAVEENAGPLLPWVANTGHRMAEFYEEVHEVLANLTLFLVVIHVTGVLFESLLHHENLIRAMITGDKRKQ